MLKIPLVHHVLGDCFSALILCAGGGSKVLSEGELVDLWERIDARVGELLEGCEPLPPPPVTFNPTSEVPIEEQK